MINTKFYNKTFRLFSALIAVLILFSQTFFVTYADMVDTNGNEYINVKKIPQIKAGKSTSFSVTYMNNSGSDLTGVEVWINDDIEGAYEGDFESGSVFPFEVDEGIFDHKRLGNVNDGKSKSFTVSARVRRDLAEGYYSVCISYTADGWSNYESEYINVWLSKTVSNDDNNNSDDKTDQITFILGEGQSTPYGVYPNVMDFSLNMRNKGTIIAYDVTVSLVMSKDSKEYPFDINDANYDRYFEKIETGQTVSLPYSMAIRSDVYSGYYPIKVNISYRESTGGELKSAESEFYVHVKNKEEEDSLGDFNVNDRTKARLVVDSFETVPKDIYAGEEFELVVRMKNASSNVGASNILFALESEKVSDSAVFSTESGSSSVVVNSLAAGAVTEIKLKLLAKAGVDQRSYYIKINEKYDSPEFKNAEESVTIDIPVKQVARLNTGTMEIMPESIAVGSETNVMFAINNTGKIILYNVMVNFEADSINKADTYVGNIKPGETGNVDIMLTGAAPTIDDGKIKITISYEDENGEISTVDKEMLLNVFEEETFSEEDVEAGMMPEDIQTETPGIGKYKIYIIAGAAAVALIAVILGVKAKKRRNLAEKEDENEIS